MGEINRDEIDRDLVWHSAFLASFRDEPSPLLVATAMEGTTVNRGRRPARRYDLGRPVNRRSIGGGFRGKLVAG